MGTVVTNNLAVFTPYEVTFRCFSQDLANVLSGFASSPHGFIVTDIKVQTAAATTAATASPGGGETMGNQSSPYVTPPRQQPSQPTSQSPSAPVGRGGLQTVLKEQLLSVTMKIEVVKLLPEI